jgi:hypothetical protein
MVSHSAPFLLAALFLLPGTASAQLRFQPPSASSPLNVRPWAPHSPIRVASVSDSVRPQTRWQEGWWAGVAFGAVFGTLIAFGPDEGKPGFFTRVGNAGLFTGLIGLPLGVIGGLIGSTSKKPVANSAPSP